MSPVRIAFIAALSVFAFAPTFAAASDSEISTETATETTEVAGPISELDVVPTAEPEAAREPKIVCRYVKTSTSRLGKKVCAPEKPAAKPEENDGAAAETAENESDEEQAQDEEPKMVCRYVKTSTSRLGTKVCAPAKD